MKVWLQPKQYERRYRRFLSKTVREVRAEFLRRLNHIIQVETFQEEFTDQFYTSAKTNISDRSDEIGILLAALLLWWQSQKSNITPTIKGLFDAISIYNDNQFRMVMRDGAKVDIPLSSRMGVYSGNLVTPTQELLSKFGDTADIYRQEPYLDGTQSNWEAIQTEYIDKITTGVISDAGLIIRNGLAIGAKAATTKVLIDKLFDTALRRVDKFGDDQVNALDTQLSKLRQQSFGFKTYEWETRRDERVRGNPAGLYPKAKPSHYARDRVIFSWVNPPEGGHPGEAPGCRCRARVLFYK